MTAWRFYPVSDIEQLCRCLCGQQEIAPLPFDPMLLLDGGNRFTEDLCEVRGQDLPNGHWRLPLPAGTTCC